MQGGGSPFFILGDPLGCSTQLDCYGMEFVKRPTLLKAQVCRI